MTPHFGFNQLHDEIPGNSSSHDVIGTLLNGKMNVVAADRSFQQDFISRAQLLIEQSRFDRAEQQLRRAISQDPENGTAFGMLGLCLAVQEKTEEAMECTDRAIHLQPDDAYGYFARAYVLHQQRRWSEASDCATEALRLDPENENIWSLKAGISITRGKWSEGYREAARAFELDPEDPRKASQYAITLIRMGDEDEAMALLAAALANDPEDACGHLANGWYQMRLGNYDQARVHYREAIRLDPLSLQTRAGMLGAIKFRSRLFRLLLPTKQLSPNWSLVFVIVAVTCLYGFLYNVSAIRGRNTFALDGGVAPPMICVTLVAIYLQLLAPYSNAIVFLTGFGRPLLLRHQIQSSLVAVMCLALGVIFLVPMLFDESWRPWIPAFTGFVVCGLVYSDLFTPTSTPKRLVRFSFAVAIALILVAALICDFTERPESSPLWHALLALQCAYVSVGVSSFVCRVIQKAFDRKSFARQRS